MSFRSPFKYWLYHDSNKIFYIQNFRVLRNYSQMKYMLLSFTRWSIHLRRVKEVKENNVIRYFFISKHLKQQLCQRNSDENWNTPSWSVRHIEFRPTSVNSTYNACRTLSSENDVRKVVLDSKWLELNHRSCLPSPLI